MRSDDDVHDERPVGYGNPPRHTRFKPGQSGNPRGRPKGSKNLRSIVETRASEKVMVTLNGEPREMTRKDLIVSSLMAKAAKGDIPALRLALPLLERSEEAGDLEAAGAFDRGHYKALLAEMDWLAEVQQAHKEIDDDEA